MNEIDSAKVRQAFNAARFMKWGSVPVCLLAIIIAAILGVAVRPLAALIFFLATWLIVFSRQM